MSGGSGEIKARGVAVYRRLKKHDGSRCVAFGFVGDEYPICFRINDRRGAFGGFQLVTVLRLSD